IADTGLDGYSRQRRDLDRAASQAFDIKSEQQLHRFKRYSRVAGTESLVAAARLERVVAATSACITGNQTRARPVCELFDGNSPKCLGAGSQTSQRRFRINATNFACQLDYAPGEIGGVSVVLNRGNTSEERWTCANECYQAGVPMRRNRPQELDPIVKTFRQRAENLSTANQDMKGRGAAPLEKVQRSSHQPV